MEYPEFKNFRITVGFTRDYLTLIDECFEYDIFNKRLVETEKNYRITFIDFDKQILRLEKYGQKNFKFKLKNINYPIETSFFFSPTIIKGKIPPKK